MSIACSKRRAFTLIELLVGLLLLSVITYYTYRAYQQQLQQTQANTMRTEIEIELKKAMETIAAEIAVGGFNPCRTPPNCPTPFSLTNIAEKINFFCLQRDRLYFASDGRTVSNPPGPPAYEYNGKIDVPTSCPNDDFCNCSMNSAGLEETTLYRFVKDPQCADSACPLLLLRNVAPGSPLSNGAPVIGQLVRGRFSYFQRDVSGAIPKVPNFTMATPFCNICDLAMIKVEMVMRSRAPIRQFQNSRYQYLPDPTLSAADQSAEQTREMALIHSAEGDYETMALVKEIVLRNRGATDLGGGQIVPLCLPPTPPCP